jgi:lipopolysaccharide exporter
MGYTKDAIKGISWLGFSKIVIRAMSFVRIAIIARLLVPEKVGLFTITTIVLSLTEILTETGINIFLVQKHAEMEKYLNTAWVISIIRGIIISVFIIITTPLIAHFYNAPEAIVLLLLVSFVPLLRGFINPSIVKFSTELQFNKEFFYRSILFFIETLTSVMLVYILRSPLGLVWGLVVGAFSEILFSFIIIHPRPKFIYDKDLFREVLQKGKWLTLTGIFNYLYHNGDTIMVGKLLGLGSTGLYDMVYKISMIPLTEISDLVSKVTFPVYVRMADDTRRMQRGFIRSIFAMSLVILPICAVLFFYPREIIAIILGSQWLVAAPVLQVLSVFGAIRAISMTVIAPVYALQKQEMITVIAIASFFGMAITIVPFIMHWGLVGAAYSALCGTLVSLPFIFYFLHKIFHIKHNV